MTRVDREKLARAIADGIGDNFDHAHESKSVWVATRGEGGGRYRDINEPRKRDYFDAADAVLSSIRDQGFVIVPREPTQKMLMAGRRQLFADMVGEHCGPSAENTYTAMISSLEEEGNA